MGVRLQQMKLDGRAGNHHSVYSTFLIGLRYWPFLFYFISNSLLKELNDTGWALVCWAWYPKDYLFIYSLFILGLLSKKNMMPSGNLRLSQETLTRTHHSTGYKKQGHFPVVVHAAPVVLIVHTTVVPAPVVLAFIPQSLSLPRPPRFCCWGHNWVISWLWPSGT